MNKLKILELFGGIGAPRRALEKLGIDFESVDYVEIHEASVKSYNLLYNENYTAQDITKWDKLLDVDLIIHGSPCQDFSSAGLQAGGNEGSGTRSSLMYETLRIVKKLNPKYIIWENVSGLVNKKNINNFRRYHYILNILGYTSYSEELNSYDFNSIQSRPRVFTVSIRNDLNTEFNFPRPIKNLQKLETYIDNEIDDCYFKISKSIQSIITKYNLNTLPKYTTIDCSFCLLKSKPNLPKFYKNKVNTILKGDYRGNKLIIGHDNKIRYITASEALKFMEFTQEDYNKLKTIQSDSEILQQAGNSINVNTLYYLFKALLIDRTETK